METDGKGRGEYQDGKGSDWFRLVIREPRECVSWIRRWRDCSRDLRWSGAGVVISIALWFGFEISTGRLLPQSGGDRGFEDWWC